MLSKEALAAVLVPQLRLPTCQRMMIWGVYLVTLERIVVRSVVAVMAMATIVVSLVIASRWDRLLTLHRMLALELTQVTFQMFLTREEITGKDSATECVAALL